MLLFTLGPVEPYDEIVKQGAKPLPYAHSEQIRKASLSICKYLKEAVKAPKASKTALLNGNGTMAMEMAVCNVFDKKDKLLLISGGYFADRFEEICKRHQLRYEKLEMELGKTLQPEQLDVYEGHGITGVLANIHESSTGVLYNAEIIGSYCKRNGAIFVADAISTFLADEYQMEKWNINVTILNTQKALALPPGISMILADKAALDRIYKSKFGSYTMYLKEYFAQMETGETPFTPAIGIIMQLEKRLQQINNTGVSACIANTREIAEDFRTKIKNFPFFISSDSLSNALTPLLISGRTDAFEVYQRLIRDYGIVIGCGCEQYQHSFLRAGHIGNLTKKKNNMLIAALNDLKRKNIIK